MRSEQHLTHISKRSLRFPMACSSLSLHPLWKEEWLFFFLHSTRNLSGACHLHLCISGFQPLSCCSSSTTSHSPFPLFVFELDCISRICHHGLLLYFSPANYFPDSVAAIPLLFPDFPPPLFISSLFFFARPGFPP